MVGLEVELEVGAVAHGGHCVARHEGRVIFVRHTLPGERVIASVTEGSDGDRFVRADATSVLRAAPGRVTPRCPVAGPGLCGGCDWQHASLATQRALKAAVVREQLQRLAGLDVEVVVEAAPGDHDGLGWRTRVQFAVGEDGALGLRRHRSHDVVPVTSCPIAHPGVEASGATAQTWAGVRSVEVVVPSAAGERPLLVIEPSGRTWVREDVAVGQWRRSFRVSGSGFWQVHPGAPSVLVAAILDGLAPQPGDQVLDLYAGAGLFAAALADRVMPGGAVLAIESDPRAVGDARHNLHDLPAVGITEGRVDRVLGQLLQSGVRADLVVLDPPRSGAGRRVVEQICSTRPRAVAYVACDPAALARDVAYAAAHGYRLGAVRAFDLFPMTHHVECVAILVPTDSETEPEREDPS